VRRISPDASAWCRAATMRERIAILSSRHCRIEMPRHNEREARRRLKEWRAQPPFDADDLFRRRLTSDRIAMRSFVRALGTRVEAVRGSPPPEWLADLDRGFCDPGCQAVLPVPRGYKGHQLLGLLNIVAPLINRGFARIRDRVRTLDKAGVVGRSDCDSIEQEPLGVLYSRLSGIVGRTMVLELNVARLRGVLKGTTAEERYSYFVRCLAQRDAAVHLLEAYPVLARQAVVCVRHWTDAVDEFFARLLTDYAAIDAAFGAGRALGTLVSVRWGAGDTHRHGRTVVVARFSSGRRVVYKPRSLDVDRHFQALLSWVNANWHGPPYRMLKMLDCARYGWIEFAAPAACTSADAVARFYIRQGGNLALLYALNAADVHCENIIASDEHPVLVDLETLFHPTRIAGTGHAQPEAADMILLTSVARTGMLPRRLWARADYEGVDLSALGGTPGQTAPGSFPFPEATGTDQMRFVRKEKLRVRLSSDNHPTAPNVSTGVLGYADELVRGFTMMYRALARDRRKLLSRDGLLARFRSSEVRVVLRPTRTYFQLLSESYHPDLQRDALDWDQFLDKLWLGVVRRPYLSKVVVAERDDLQNGDVPIFTTRPGSSSLWTSQGKRIARFAREPSVCEVADRLQTLNEDDLRVQTRIIRMSLATLATNPGATRTPTGHASERTLRPCTAQLHDALVEEAQSIARRLDTQALRADGDVNWLALEPVAELTNAVTTMGVNLYSGLAGVVLFLASLQRVTGSRRYAPLAEDALDAMRRRLSRFRKSGSLGVGCYTGWGGIIYTLTHLAMLSKASQLLRDAAEFLPTIDALVAQDRAFDIMSGAAGCILGLASLHSVAPDDQIISVAAKCGDRLAKCARPQQHGIAWPTAANKGRPLLGMSHGAAGIAGRYASLPDSPVRSAFSLWHGRQSLTSEVSSRARAAVGRTCGSTPDRREVTAAAGRTDPCIHRHGAMGRLG